MLGPNDAFGHRGASIPTLDAERPTLLIDEAKFVFPVLATLDSGCAAVTQRGEPDPPGCRPTTHSNSRSFTEAVAWRTEALRFLESDARTETTEGKEREPTAAPAGRHQTPP